MSLNNQEDSQEFPYSPTEMFMQLQLWDNTCEAVAYICSVEGITVSPQNPSQHFYKFHINNNQGQKIGVIAWNDRATFVEGLKLQCNQVINIDGAKVRSIPGQYKTGTQYYELCVESNTKLDILGEKKVGVTDKKKEEIELTEWKDVAKSLGLVKIEGWIKKNFSSLLNRFKNTTEKCYGFITDAEYKLEVRISNYDKNHKFERGQCVELFGSMQKDDGELYLLVDSMTDISGVDKPKLPLIKILGNAKNITG